jgi:hypothetical protein
MPDFRFSIEGTLTNSNPQQENFTCWDLLLPAVASNFTSGAWASDGVTPRWDGLHFCATRVGSNNADNGSGGLQLQNGSFTFIGGEVQVAGAIGLTAGTTPRSYYTRWRNTKEWGASSSRIRSYTNLAVFRTCEFFDIAFDLFRMPAEFSVKGRGCEYLAQYVGAQAGGADAKFTATNLENVDGTYDFDNYFSGWIELYNCAKGANLSVVTQYPNSAQWTKHCVPLYQDLIITAKNTAGVVVQDVRFSCTDSPTNSPTTTISTQANLKTWDFRDPITYQTTTNSSGVATSTPVLNVWYWSTTFKQNLRFPASTATYEGRAANYKTMTVSVVLGASAAIPVSAGMVGLDTPMTITETAALALTGITLTPSGATGGVIDVTVNCKWIDIWNKYRAHIAQFANRASQDTWDCLSGLLYSKAWTLNVATGVVITGDSDISSYKTNGTVTLNGTARIQSIYTSSAGTATIIEQLNVTSGASTYVGNNATGVTKNFQASPTGTTVRTYFAPGENAPQKVVRELYGYQRDERVITPSGGLIQVTYSDVQDIGISQPTLATVLAYSTIENWDKAYDRVAAFRLTEQGIKIGQIATRNGTTVDFSAPYSGLVHQGAASAFSLSGNVFTFKATAFANGSKYINATFVPPATFTANSNEVISANFEDANGNSKLTMLSDLRSGAQIWKIPSTTPSENYATGTLVATVTAANPSWRFIGDAVAGYDYLGMDNYSTTKARCTATKGIYTLEAYSGGQVVIAQAPQIEAMNTKMDVLKVDMDSSFTAVPTAVWAKVIEAGYTAEQMMRLIAAESAGTLSGAGTDTETFTGIDGTTERIIATVTEEGNRTAITLNGS